MIRTPTFEHFRIRGHSIVSLPEYSLLIGGYGIWGFRDPDSGCSHENRITKLTFPELEEKPIKWDTIGTLLFPRWGHRAMINDGRVFIIGGNNDENDRKM